MTGEPADAALFETGDPERAEAYLSHTYAATRLHLTGEPGRVRMQHRRVGPALYGRFGFGFDLDYTGDLAGMLVVAAVAAGGIEARLTDGHTHHCGPGEVMAFEPPDRPNAGTLRHPDHQVALLDPGVLDRLTDPAAGPGDQPGTRVLGHVPVSPAAGRQMAAAIEHFAATAAYAADAPLVAAAAADLLAATMLATFPNNSRSDPTPGDRRDAHPDTVRRAAAYIDAHAELDISLADIARAAFVTIRAVQLAFRRHLDTTPLGYLKQVRMDRAHQDLLAAVHGDGQTVTSISHARGFSHPGRFAIAYKTAYGTSPQSTLRR